MTADISGYFKPQSSHASSKSGISPALGPLKADGTLDKTHFNETGGALFGALMAKEVRRVAPSLAAHVHEAKLPRVTAP